MKKIAVDGFGSKTRVLIGGLLLLLFVLWIILLQQYNNSKLYQDAPRLEENLF